MGALLDVDALAHFELTLPQSPPQSHHFFSTLTLPFYGSAPVLKSDPWLKSYSRECVAPHHNALALQQASADSLLFRLASQANQVATTPTSLLLRLRLSTSSLAVCIHGFRHHITS